MIVCATDDEEVIFLLVELAHEALRLVMVLTNHHEVCAFLGGVRFHS